MVLLGDTVEKRDKARMARAEINVKTKKYVRPQIRILKNDILRVLDVTVPSAGVGCQWYLATKLQNHEVVGNGQQER